MLRVNEFIQSRFFQRFLERKDVTHGKRVSFVVVKRIEVNIRTSYNIK